MKCHYCPEKAETIYSDEYLCNRHYNILYADEKKVVQVSEVPKTEEEKKLHSKYMKALNRGVTPKLIQRFKKDLQKLKKLEI